MIQSGRNQDFNQWGCRSIRYHVNQISPSENLISKGNLFRTKSQDTASTGERSLQPLDIRNSFFQNNLKNRPISSVIEIQEGNQEISRSVPVQIIELDSSYIYLKQMKCDIFFLSRSYRVLNTYSKVDFSF